MSTITQAAQGVSLHSSTPYYTRLKNTEQAVSPVHLLIVLDHYFASWVYHNQIYTQGEEAKGKFFWKLSEVLAMADVTANGMSVLQRLRACLSATTHIDNIVFSIHQVLPAPKSLSLTLSEHSNKLLQREWFELIACFTDIGIEPEPQDQKDLQLSWIKSLIIAITSNTPIVAPAPEPEVPEETPITSEPTPVPPTAAPATPVAAPVPTPAPTAPTFGAGSSLTEWFAPPATDVSPAPAPADLTIPIPDNSFMFGDGSSLSLSPPSLGEPVPIPPSEPAAPEGVSPAAQPQEEPVMNTTPESNFADLTNADADSTPDVSATAPQVGEPSGDTAPQEAPAGDEPAAPAEQPAESITDGDEASPPAGFTL